MVVRQFVLLVLVALLLAGSAPSAVSASACGDVTLIIVNPDLQVGSDGFAHASGAFFLQVRPEGSDADTVSQVSVALGAHFPDAARSCDATVPLTGAYPLLAQTDDSAADGFFVPVNTTTLLDQEYGLVVRALDADGDEIARRLVDVVVENGRASPADAASVDRVGPWPRVLPGDGEQSRAGAGLTVEFAERVADVSVTINGVHVPLDAATTRVEEVTLPLSALTVHGHVSEAGVANGDVVRVTATDLAGNRAEKIVRAGAAGTTAPGVDAPDGEWLTLAYPDGRTHVVARGGALAVDVNVTNAGRTDARVILTAQAPSAFNVTIEPGNLTVPANGTESATARVSVDPDGRAGEYAVIVTLSWTEGGTEFSYAKSFDVHVTNERLADPVDAGGSGSDATGGNGTVADDPLDAADAEADASTAGGDDARASRWAVPAPMAPAVLAGLAAAACALRRRGA